MGDDSFHLERVMFPAPLGQCVLREAETQLYGMCGELTKVYHHLGAMCSAHGKELYDTEYVQGCMEKHGKEKRHKVDMEEFVVFALKPKVDRAGGKDKLMASLDEAVFAGNEFFACVKTGMLGVDLLGNLVWNVQRVLGALRMKPGGTRVSESALLGELGIANVEYVVKDGDALEGEPAADVEYVVKSGPAKSTAAVEATESVQGHRVKRKATVDFRLMKFFKN